MGCLETRTTENYKSPSLPQEEMIIVIKEKEVFFCSITTENLEKSIKSNSINNLLSIAQLRKSIGDLGCNSNEFVVKDEVMLKLMTILQNSNKLFEYKTIMIFGILLCEGDPKDKSLSLFRLYDTDNKKILTRDVINVMIEELIDISINKIPRLAIDDDDNPEPNTLSKFSVNKYTKYLLKSKDKFISKILDLLLDKRNVITQDQFIKNVAQNALLEALVSSSKLRLFIYKLDTSSYILI